MPPYLQAFLPSGQRSPTLHLYPTVGKHKVHQSPMIIVSQVQLQEAKGKAEEFHQAYLAIKDKVAHFEEVQEKREPIHSEVEAVEQQLETHKVSS